MGIDPTAAGPLERVLGEARSCLDGDARRLQQILDQVGVACEVPREIRDVALWCGLQSHDLGRRREVVATSGGEPAVWSLSRGLTTLTAIASGLGGSRCFCCPSPSMNTAATPNVETAAGRG